MPPCRQESQGPTATSKKEPGIRLCPHTCPNPENLCDCIHVYTRAGNSCKRHARVESKHKECSEAYPAHKSHDKKKCVLKCELTYSEWMALSPKDRTWYKQHYRAETPPTEAPPVPQGEEEEEEDDNEDENDKVSFLFPFIQFTFNLSVSVQH